MNTNSHKQSHTHIHTSHEERKRFPLTIFKLDNEQLPSLCRSLNHRIPGDSTPNRKRKENDNMSISNKHDITQHNTSLF